MDKTTDYIAWLGDIDFTVRPLGEVDAIVLCTLAYYDFGPVIPEIAGKRGGFFLKDILPCMESGKIEIRPKSEIKAIIGHSPDAFDAVLLSIQAVIKHLGDSVYAIT